MSLESPTRSVLPAEILPVFESHYYYRRKKCLGGDWCECGNLEHAGLDLKRHAILVLSSSYSEGRHYFSDAQWMVSAPECSRSHN